MAEELRLDAVVVDKFSKPLTDLRKKLADVKPGSGVKDIRREFGELHTQLQRVSATISGPIRSALTGLGVSGLAAGAGIAGIAAGLKSFAGNVSELKALNQETKISVENFRRLRAAAPFFGLQADQMDAGLRKFAENMHDFAKKRGEAFSELAVKAPQVAKALQDSISKGDVNGALDKALDFIIQERQRNPQNARRFAELLFGNADLSSLGARGAEKFRETLREIARNMKPLTKAEIESAEGFEDSINRLQRAFGNMGDTIAKNLNPVLMPMMEEFGKWVEMNKGAVGAGIRDSIEYLKTVDWKQIGNDLKVIGQAFVMVANGIVRTVEALKEIRQQGRSKALGQETGSLLGEALKKQQRLQDLDAEIKKLDELPESNGAAKGRKLLLEEERRKLQESMKDGTKEGVKDGFREMFQLQSLTGGMGGGPRLWNASLGGAATSFGGGMGGGRAGGGGGGGFVDGPISDVPGSMKRSEVVDYIREAAKARGIDPNVAVGVARSEGLRGYVGDRGTSFGPFQLHYKNNIPGLSNSGLGDVFTRQTGLHARDPSTVRQQIDFALNYAAKNGWGPWHGWRGPRFAGISRDSRPMGISGNGERVITTSDGRRLVVDRNGKALRWANEGGTSPSWPAEWKMRSEIGASAAGTSALGGAGNVDPKGRLDIHLHGAPGGTRTRADMGGLFRDVSINRGQNMVASSEAR